MSYNLPEAVHVDMRVDGETISKDFGPGVVDLPQPVADLLVSQGLATQSTSKSKAGKAAETTEG